MRSRTALLHLYRTLSGLFLVLVTLFMVGPLVVIIGASLDGGDHSFLNFPPESLSLRWYLAIPGPYWQTLGTSLLLALACTGLSLVIGVPAALGIVRGSLPGRSFIASIFRTPLQIPAIVAGIAFLQAYYAIAGMTGLRLVDTFGGLLVAHMFIAVPYIVGSCVSVLYRFNNTLEEAAYSLGASPLSTFFKVTLPVIAPGVYAGSIYAFITSFDDVPISLLVGGSKYTTFPVYLFTSMQFDFNSSILAVSSVVIIISMAIMILAQRFSGIGTRRS